MFRYENNDIKFHVELKKIIATHLYYIIYFIKIDFDKQIFFWLHFFLIKPTILTNNNKIL